MEKKHEKNIILFVGKVYGHMGEAVREYEKKSEKQFRLALLVDQKAKKPEGADTFLDLVITCDTSSPISIQKALLPYQDDILVATCRGEDQITFFAKVIPHIPFAKTPSSESLLWASDKIWMRRRLFTYNKKITPSYTLVSNTEELSIKRIEKKVGYPLIVKPTGLAASRLVTICYHRQELEKVLKVIFKKINQVYKETGGSGEPKVLVEQFMEGEMYSVDGYVTSRGKVYFCPMVHIKTGRAIGFDDFFGYQQITPTLLKKESIASAEDVARQAVHALALRSTTAHVELMKTENGWKIIELGARIGGFRHMMYDLSYGINHTMNDILIRIPEKPIINKKIKGYTAAMKFFAKKEGRMTKFSGIKRIQELESFKKIYINKKVGDACIFAKNGGSSVFNIILFNKERSKLLADIRRMEQTVDIQTTKRK
jgi:biotin carboxylase